MPTVSRSSGSVNGRNKGVLQQELWQFIFIWLHQDPKKTHTKTERERGEKTSIESWNQVLPADRHVALDWTVMFRLCPGALQTVPCSVTTAAYTPPISYACVAVAWGQPAYLEMCKGSLWGRTLSRRIGWERTNLGLMRTKVEVTTFTRYRCHRSDRPTVIQDISRYLKIWGTVDDRIFQERAQQTRSSQRFPLGAHLQAQGRTRPCRSCRW